MKLLCTIVTLCALSACGGGGSSVAGPVTVEVNSNSICSATGIPTTCAKMFPADWVVDDRAITGLSLHSLANGYSNVWVGGPIGKNGVQQAFNNTPHTSQFIVVELGGNDAYEARDPVVFEADLRVILLHIRAIGKVPVVTGIVPFKAGPPGFDAATVARAIELNAIVHRVAIELSVTDAHWDAAPFDSSTDTVDGIHRTETALRKLVARLVDTIKGIK